MYEVREYSSVRFSLKRGDTMHELPVRYALPGFAAEMAPLHRRIEVAERIVRRMAVLISRIEERIENDALTPADDVASKRFLRAVELMHSAYRDAILLLCPMLAEHMDYIPAQDWPRVYAELVDCSVETAKKKAVSRESDRTSSSAGTDTGQKNTESGTSGSSVPSSEPSKRKKRKRKRGRSGRSLPSHNPANSER